MRQLFTEAQEWEDLAGEAFPGYTVNILGGTAAIRQPTAKPTWLASMKRKDGTPSTTSAAPQAQSPAQRRRLKPIAGFSPRRCPSTKEPFGSASQLQQLRPAPPCLAPA